jgi:hypothetical protein
MLGNDLRNLGFLLAPGRHRDCFVLAGAVCWREIMRIIRKRRAYRISAAAVGALALGSFAIGALAVGALAIGRLAIGRLAVGKGSVASLHVRGLSVEQLKVGDLEISGSLKLPAGADLRSEQILKPAEEKT